MSSDYYGFLAGEIADAGRNAALNEQLRSLALLRRYPAALRYAEDFEREWRATLNDPLGRAALTLAYQQEQAHGEACGGQRCCGTRDEVHNPWCRTGPRRWRDGTDEVARRTELYGTCEGYGAGRDARPTPRGSGLTYEFYCPGCEGTVPGG